MPVGLFPVTGITANPNRLQYSSANVACPSSLPPKADRHGGLSPLTIGGLFRPDHRKAPAGLNCTALQLNSCESDYFPVEALRIKISLSIFSVMGLCSLRDELPNFAQ